MNANSHPFASALVLLGLLVSGLKGAEPQELDDRLRNKLSALESKTAESLIREVHFKEERHFPFRKLPVELDGIIRLWRGKGVSIHYPDERTVVITDDSGVLLRKLSNDGSFRQKRMPVRDLDTAQLLRAAFEFDRLELERIFHLNWEEQEDTWSITMTPRNGVKDSLERVVMTGRDLTIEKVDLAISENKRIVILPLEERSMPAFSEEEQTLFFRTSPD